MARKTFRKKRRSRRGRRRRFRKRNKNTIMINPRSRVIVPMRKVENIQVVNAFQKNSLEFTADTDFPQVYNSWAGCFDFYRVVNIRQDYYPNATVFTAPMTFTSDDTTTSADGKIAPALNSPIMLMKVLRDGQQLSPVDIDEALEQPSYRVYDLRRKKLTFNGKPNLLSEVIDDSAITTAQAPIWNKWLSVAEGNVPYYYKHRVISVPNATVGGYLNIRVITTFMVEFKVAK